MRSVINVVINRVVWLALAVFIAGCEGNMATVQDTAPAVVAPSEPASVPVQPAEYSGQSAMQGPSGIEVQQVNRQFVMSNSLVQEVNVKVGEEIRFKNADDTAHNIFSSSDIKTFDLGSFLPGEMRSISFEKPGKALVECAIHPQMQLDINVD